eukprot:TRINITY_DN740_c0_g1_i2.p1 TRINITY_DN740_c0_g1~~TRINITY_DN740_c0_g1_i2.p1  ORF type:complete len:213 (-),score=32.48 TRINITY_DN740_c0_g1_i2:434-1072(-)
MLDNGRLRIGLFGNGWRAQRLMRALRCSVGQRAFLPYLSLLLNCAVWSLYGWLSAQRTIVAVNAFGLVTASICISVYLRNSAPLARARYEQHTMAALLGVLLLFGLGVWDHVMAVQVVGLVASMLSIAVFASPLAQLAHVVRTRDTSSLSFVLALASAAASASWTAFGYLVQDSHVLLPNALGLALSIAQLSLFVFFGTSPSRETLKAEQVV